MSEWENPPDAVWVWGKYGTYRETYCHAEEIKQEEFEIPVTKYVRADIYAALEAQNAGLLDQVLELENLRDALEAQLAEVKGKLNEIACWSQSQGLLWWQVKAREALSALEATPPAPKVTEEMIAAGLENYSEGGCMGLSEDERREVVISILTAAQEAGKP